MLKQGIGTAGDREWERIDIAEARNRHCGRKRLGENRHCGRRGVGENRHCGRQGVGENRHC